MRKQRASAEKHANAHAIRCTEKRPTQYMLAE